MKNPTNPTSWVVLLLVIGCTQVAQEDELGDVAQQATGGAYDPTSPVERTQLSEALSGYWYAASEGNGIRELYFLLGGSMRMASDGQDIDTQPMVKMNLVVPDWTAPLTGRIVADTDTIFPGTGTIYDREFEVVVFPDVTDLDGRSALSLQELRAEVVQPKVLFVQGRP